MKPVVLIPARLAATRLPDKPLADINGRAMILHCIDRALEADVGPVLVAAGDPEIVEAVTRAGGDAVLTDPSLPSGSDRIWAALNARDPDGEYDAIINVQGDLPTLDPQIIRTCFEHLASGKADIVTPVAEITVEEEKINPNVVKAFAAFEEGNDRARALAFTRATAPWGAGPLYHHIGLYAYRREALARFVSLPQSPLEKREKLEQLRTLENGMRIDVVRVNTVPLGVDTQADLERARTLLKR